jgi:hypothetical protein
VDASGRGSVLPRWLGEIGCAAPNSELLPVPVGYASCTFKAPERRPPWRALLASGAPARRGGVMFPIEGNRFLLTLTGFFDEPMPQDHDAFLAYAASLPVPNVHAAIRGLEPASEIRHFRFAGSLRRRYEALDRFPPG